MWLRLATITAAGVMSSGAMVPSANDAAALGASGSLQSPICSLASGGIINWDAGDVTITHSADLLAFAGATSGYSFDYCSHASGQRRHVAGCFRHGLCGDLFLATGAVVNYGAGNAI